MKIEKSKILSEIKRIATQNGGVPPSTKSLEVEAGIRKGDWYGKYWAKWSDALIEAGFQPNVFGSESYDNDLLLEKWCQFAIEIGHFPTQGEYKLKSSTDKEFPDYSSFYRHYGLRENLAKKTLDFCMSRPEFKEVVGYCNSILATNEVSENESVGENSFDIENGHVYLLKHEDAYKIGRSLDASKRYKEIRVQMPHKTEEIHVIETDDPVGIEAYWHNRFKEKRLEGEWFRLSSSDIKAFKKRRFM